MFKCSIFHPFSDLSSMSVYPENSHAVMMKCQSNKNLFFVYLFSKHSNVSNMTVSYMFIFGNGDTPPASHYSPHI